MQRLAFLCSLSLLTQLQADGVDFSREVKPILASNCFQCHGPDESTREAGLCLDQRDVAVSVLGSGSRAIVPGKPEQSELIERVSAPDGPHRMPPVAVKKRLTPAQVETLRDWIAEGAEYQQHWAFVAPKRPAIPDNAPEWSRSPIDRFVRAKLDAAGLTPAEAASRVVWLRRATLDLTGLPPSVADVDRFLADESPDARQRAADRLLADPAYGERWARQWLDLARYADSAGYAQDPPRVIWRYRDWVIDSLNAGMPFDQFTVEQLAGDMLPDPTDDQLIATAFHRNTMTNSEGGTNDEEFRNAAVVDRVNTTMQGWMGITMGCAQCHTHKYDPITHTEYFRMFAVFNNTADADRGNEAPTLERFTAEQERLRESIRADIAKLESEIASAAKTNPRATPTPKPVSGPLNTRFVRVELPGKGRFLHLAEVQAFAGEENVARKGAASQVSTDFGGPASFAIDGNTDGNFQAKSTSHTAAGDDPWWQVKLKADATLDRVVIWNRTDGGTAARLKPFRVVLLDSESRPIWVRQFDEAPESHISVALPRESKDLTDKDRAALAGYPAPAKLNSPQLAKLTELKKRLAAIKGVPTPIMEELPKGKQRQTHIQIRGNYTSLGDLVTPGVPEVFPNLPEGVEANRLGIARWLVSDENPLTARVTVNRYWEELFGRGIVETSEDFGTQGEPPTHPELLDWLATELLRVDWDTKRLLREVVLSGTYGQSSAVTATKLDADPSNHLLSRGPRFRLSAEMIRDQALQVGGLLSRKMNGPSVRPPQPKLGRRAAFGGSVDWEPSPGEDRFRRGLYTSWRRTTPYPSMITFDAPSREVCTIRRIRTNTPLQALVTLNDPVFIEAARGLALRTMGTSKDTRERATFAFRLCLGRPPEETELDRIVELHARLLEEYRSERENAQKLAGELPAGADPTEAAAWTVIGNVLMNLDEFLARR